MTSGTLIVLNGNSSAGKSTVARLMQTELPDPFLHTGIDHFLHCIPEPLIGPPDEGAARAWEVTFTKGEMTSVPRTTPLGYQIINGVYAAIAAYCRAGNNAIVDTVFHDPEALKLARDNFAGLGVLSVGLHCELAEAKRREMSRGDRAPGGAAAFHPLVHMYVRYDLSLDVTYMPAAQAAHRIASAYIRHQTGTAFWAS